MAKKTSFFKRHCKKSFFSVQVSCGRKIAENLTYWESDGLNAYTTGGCNVEVCKIVDSIAQIRLNFNYVSTIRTHEIF